MNVKVLKESMYETKVVLIWNCTEDELSEYIRKKYGIYVIKTGGLGRYFNIDSGAHFIYLSSFDWSIPDQGLLHHEIFHATANILGDIGLVLSSDSEEAYAYFHQGLVCQCLGALRIEYEEAVA